MLSSITFPVSFILVLLSYPILEITFLPSLSNPYDTFNSTTYNACRPNRPTDYALPYPISRPTDQSTFSIMPFFSISSLSCFLSILLYPPYTLHIRTLATNFIVRLLYIQPSFSPLPFPSKENCYPTTLNQTPLVPFYHPFHRVLIHPLACSISLPA
ncbi:hypothetical protein GE21DRAFT_1057732 [Neurospora crassa]|nr:hypothetical protein GE21DRAFT_1057732 [Neurospora crassa]